MVGLIWINLTPRGRQEWLDGGQGLIRVIDRPFEYFVLTSKVI